MQTNNGEVAMCRIALFDSIERGDAERAAYMTLLYVHGVKVILRKEAASRKQYNGHKNWNHWNVSLWIGNDEGLYRLAKDLIRENGTLDKAAEAMLTLLPAKTPDGASYNVTTVRAAMRGL